VARLAGAVHLLQSATLTTDDVFDFADVRYHHPTIHRRYDVSHAIVAAEVLQSIAMQCINAELERPGFHNRVLVLNLFHQIVKDLYAGQHLDVCSTANLHVTTRDYRRVIELGAGWFFANLARVPRCCGVRRERMSRAWLLSATTTEWDYSSPTTS
jgi:geranylgeranyl pyrophosphate synthase